jgi:hypothetical protein
MLRMTPHSVQTPADITMPAAKPRLTTAVEAVILAKRMREVLTPRSGMTLLRTVIPLNLFA